MEHAEQALSSARELMKLLAADEDPQDTLSRIAGLACQAVQPAAMAGISALSRGRWKTTVCTDPTVQRVDKVQYDVENGPCVESARTNEVRRMKSASHEKRWPEFAQAAVEAGINSTVSFPLSLDGEAVGALNLYAPHDEAFAEEDEATGLLFAQQAAVAFMVSDRYWRARALGEQLEVALENRDVIGQAKGIIMARLGCTADAAFDLLKRESQNRNVKLREIADEIALTGQIPG